MMIKKILLFLWQLPQNIIGFFAIVLLDAYKPCAIYDVDLWLHYKTFFTSVSLGMFIIMNGYKYTEKDIKHEMGHQIQSMSLGWLYIPYNRAALCYRQYFIQDSRNQKEIQLLQLAVGEIG